MAREFIDSAEDPMNEVLADFIGYPVSVKLKDGTWLTGKLEPNPEEYADGYKIGSYAFEKDEVIKLRDEEDS